jgi:hypothetical protein
MNTSNLPTEDTEIRREVRKRFRIAACVSNTLICLLDAQEEMDALVDLANRHPNERGFIVSLFLDSFGDNSEFKWAAEDLMAYCMATLRWEEIRQFILTKKREDIAKHGIITENVWGTLLEAFEDGWHDKYFRDFTKETK